MTDPKFWPTFLHFTTNTFIASCRYPHDLISIDYGYRPTTSDPWIWSNIVVPHQCLAEPHMPTVDQIEEGRLEGVAVAHLVKAGFGKVIRIENTTGGDSVMRFTWPTSLLGGLNVAKMDVPIPVERISDFIEQYQWFEASNSDEEIERIPELPRTVRRYFEETMARHKRKAADQE